MRHRSVADDLGDAGRATAWVGEQVAGAELADDLRYNVEVCVEEALANLVEHGRPIEGGKDIAISVTADGVCATIVITDRCVPFDSTRAPPARAPSSGPMPVGGRGLRLMQALASELGYRTHSGRNELTMRFCSPP